MSGSYAVSTGAEAGDTYYNKEKKLGWFTRWFDRKCKESWERSQFSNQPMPPRIIAAVEEPGFNVEGLSIRLYGATGGHIVEFRRYDRHKDRHDNRMYVISTEKDFTESFTRIVSMEMMR